MELKNFKDLRLPEKAPVEPSPQVQPARGNRRKETVVNADIKYKPIDKVAARVVAPAPWWAQAPPLEPKFMRPQDFDNEQPPLVKSKRMLTEKGHVETMIETKSLIQQSVLDHAKDAKDDIKKTEEIAERAEEAILAVHHLIGEIYEPWQKYREFMTEALREAREQRIAIGAETRLLMTSLRDVRQFFLEANYETQIQRLHEFVDLCERLKALKESGFLDAISDTILKL